jgi:hypothetical protein
LGISTATDTVYAAAPGIPPSAALYMPLLFPFPNGPMALVRIKR